MRKADSIKGTGFDLLSILENGLAFGQAIADTLHVKFLWGLKDKPSKPVYDLNQTDK